VAYKDYSESEIAEAMVLLAVNKYDYKKTADTLGISDRTLRRWDKDATKKGVPELLERAIERMLMVIPDKMSGNEWSISLGILIDKWLLMQGAATSRTESIVTTLQEMQDDEFDRVLEEAEQIIESARGGSNNGHKP